MSLITSMAVIVMLPAMLQTDIQGTHRFITSTGVRTTAIPTLLSENPAPEEILKPEFLFGV